MIDLTRLNGNRVVVNCDFIKLSEATPDTTLTLVNGERLIVRETLDEVLNKVASWRSSILRLAWPVAASAFDVQGSCPVASPAEEAKS